MSATKYDAVIFSNGRVVLYDSADFENAVENGQELLIICAAWSGGYALIRGADKVQNYEEWEGDLDGFHYDCYAREVKNESFTSEGLKKFYKVIISQGEMIYMETGDQANAYQAHEFIDWCTSEKDYASRVSWSDSKPPIDKARRTIDERRTIASVCTNRSDHFEDNESRVRTLMAYGVLSDKALDTLHKWEGLEC